MRTSDLIDRQALKDKLKRWDERDPYEFVEIALHAVDDAPTIEPASPWHRVEEPPKEHMWCFVYTKDAEMIMPIRIAFYVASCTGKGSWYHYESGEDIDDEVDYWTPMYLEGPDVEWPIEPPKEDNR